MRRSSTPALLSLLIGGLLVLLGLSCSQSQRPVERRSAVVPSQARELAGQFDLVDIREVLPDIAVDLRYGTHQNVAKRALYPPNMPCLLRSRTAAKLQQAQAWLRPRGYSLRIWDAWRPPEVQLMLYERATHRELFLDPRSDWSRHCSGTAVDVTLVDLEGREQRLPTYHDEATPHSGYHYQGKDPAIARNLWLLQSAMTEAGFQMIDTEWWHFDDAFYVQHPAPIIFGHQLGITISDP